MALLPGNPAAALQKPLQLPEIKGLQGLMQQQRTPIQQPEAQVQRFAPGQTTGIPQWLKPLDPNFSQDAEAERGGRNLDLLSSVSGLAEPANRLASETAAYKRAQAAARAQAQRESAAARGSEIADAVGGGMGIGDTGSGSNAPLPPGAEGRRQVVLNAAAKYLGKLPYSWGGGGLGGPSKGIDRGANTYGFDCSGLTEYAFGQAGFKIGGSTYPQYPWAKAHGKVVPVSKLVPGDIVFGNMGKAGPGHVAIYWGNGQIIEAKQTGTKIMLSKMRPGQFGIHLNY